jgi:hypothetical protein
MKNNVPLRVAVFCGCPAALFFGVKAGLALAGADGIPGAVLAEACLLAGAFALLGAFMWGGVVPAMEKAGEKC